MAITLPPSAGKFRDATQSLSSSISRYSRSCQISFYSASKVLIRRRADSSLGKMRITRSRLLTSSFKRSCIFVLRNRLRYFSGRLITAMASSNPSSMHSTDLGGSLGEVFDEFRQALPCLIHVRCLQNQFSASHHVSPVPAGALTEDVSHQMHLT